MPTALERAFQEFAESHEITRIYVDVATPIDHDEQLITKQYADGNYAAVGSVGTKGDKGDPGPPGVKGDPGDKGEKGDDGRDGTGVTIVGNVANAAALNPAYAGADGDMFIASDTGHGHIWKAGAWIDAGKIQGPAGPSAVSADANNAAILSATDNLVFVPPFRGTDTNGYMPLVADSDPDNITLTGRYRVTDNAKYPETLSGGAGYLEVYALSNTITHQVLRTTGTGKVWARSRHGGAWSAWTQQDASSSLPLAGGTMTGALTLAADAVAAMQAVTKQQMEANFTDRLLGHGSNGTYSFVFGSNINTDGIYTVNGTYQISSNNGGDLPPEFGTLTTNKTSYGLQQIVNANSGTILTRNKPLNGSWTVWKYQTNLPQYLYSFGSNIDTEPKYLQNGVYQVNANNTGTLPPESGVLTISLTTYGVLQRLDADGGNIFTRNKISGGSWTAWANQSTGGLTMWTGTQTAYNGLTPDADTLYFITG